MTIERQFQPNWATAPGGTIAELLQANRLSIDEFASHMGISIEDANNLVDGRGTITVSIARQLSVVLGASSEFWMSRDIHYRQDAKRFAVDEMRWLDQLPLTDMIEYRWISPPPRPSEELTVCLDFFGVASISEWRESFGDLLSESRFRSSPSFESQLGSVAAWLRQGLIQAEGIECDSWNPRAFLDSFGQIRPLTRQKDPAEFIPRLQEICSRNGVAVVIVRSPSGCRASGATRFINPTKAVLQLSFRYLTDDHFWFTFFHEAGHLLLHGASTVDQSISESQLEWIIEDINGPESEREDEANRFAVDTLIPIEFQQELMQIPMRKRDLVKFARRVGVSPGIIVGQWQHKQRIGYDRLNGFKRRYKWSS